MVVWGIASREDEATVSSFVEQLGLTYTILLDVDGSVNETYSQQAAFGSSA